MLEFLQPDFERTSLSAIASDVRSSMLEELDFEMEAGNVEEFRQFLVDQDLRDVATAPRIYSEFLVLDGCVGCSFVLVLVCGMTNRMISM